MNFDSFINWDYLGNFTGVVTIVSLIVQFTKGLPDKLPYKVPTRLYSYFVSIIVLLLTEIFTPTGNGLCLQEAVMTLFNGLIVSIAANGSYDCLTKFFKGEECNNEHEHKDQNISGTREV